MLYKVLSLLFIVWEVSAVYYEAEDKYSSSVCPQYWYPYKDSCYRFFDYEVNWSLAESECRLYGFNSHLVSIHSVDENDFVFAFQGGFNNMWIGLNDAAETGTYRWSDGSPFDFYTWQPDQPDHSCGLRCSSDCVEMAAWSSYSDRWNDEDCDQNRRFICKQPQTLA
ncbi:C-type lectin LmsL-like [Ptychodera flava]|uniref:C-type lectin LmsL-like n=1 Tax=Ptychodera flava TaxID=63121 RepID=UPI00396A62D8